MAQNNPYAQPKPGMLQTQGGNDYYSQYAGKGNPYNEISYLKNLWEAPGSTQGQKDWASQQANQYYNNLDPLEAQKIRAMSGTTLTNYMNQQKQTENFHQSAQQDQVNFDDYRTESATIEDLAKKYGFDYSRDYAKTQAEAEAQAKRNAISEAERRNTSNRDVNMKGIDNNLMSMAENLDRDYFQKYMQQAKIRPILALTLV